MKTPLITLFLFFFLFLTFAVAQQPPQMRLEDKIRIREAMTISMIYGDRIWEGLNDVPFAIVFVTDSVEFLIDHPKPAKDFIFIADDTLLQTTLYYRRRQFDTHFLATFPAFNEVNCIVVGTPENTGLKSTEWIITLLHEHFHQYAYSSPGYFQQVDSLNLSNNDTTGMWMLNYPFPYDNPDVLKEYEKYTKSLSKTLLAIGTNNFQKTFSNYKSARKSFQKSLSPADYRYFSFQVWQEGIARYTEYKFLEYLKNDEPSAEVKNLPGFTPYDKYVAKFFDVQTNRLTQIKLNEAQRDCFYAIGFAEGLILDKLNPKWRENFLKDKFNIEKYSSQFK